MTNIDSNSISAEEAVRMAGGWVRVSKEFRISGQAVRKWCAKNKVPSGRVYRLCEMGGFKAKPHQVRPDVFPATEESGAA